MKFKVGDRVRIKSGAADMGAPHVESMREFEGETGVVVKLSGTSYGVMMDCDPLHCWWWLKRAVEPVSEETALKPAWRIIIEGGENTSRAKYIVGKSVVKEASANRYHKDKHDPAMAARALIGKMFPEAQKKEEPPKYFTGRVVCVKTVYHRDLTVGKIYDFAVNDGRGENNRGGLLLVSPAKDIIEINLRLNSEFIEIKE